MTKCSGGMSDSRNANQASAQTKQNAQLGHLMCTPRTVQQNMHKLKRVAPIGTSCTIKTLFGTSSAHPEHRHLMHKLKRVACPRAPPSLKHSNQRPQPDTMKRLRIPAAKWSWTAHDISAVSHCEAVMSTVQVLAGMRSDTKRAAPECSTTWPPK